jgi:hypothetical protein
VSAGSAGGGGAGAAAVAGGAGTVFGADDAAGGGAGSGPTGTDAFANGGGVVAADAGADVTVPPDGTAGVTPASSAEMVASRFCPELIEATACVVLDMLENARSGGTTKAARMATRTAILPPRPTWWRKASHLSGAQGPYRSCLGRRQGKKRPWEGANRTIGTAARPS